MKSNIHIDKLPDEIKKEVMDYAEFLMQKYGSSPKKMSFKWEAGLAGIPGETTSVQLQHKALEMR